MDEPSSLKSNCLKLVIHRVWYILLFQAKEKVVDVVSLYDVKSCHSHEVVEEIVGVVWHLDVKQRYHDDNLLRINHGPELIH